MEHPKRIGDRTTMAVMLAFAESGYVQYLPFGENTRRDLVIDDGSRLLRVQCKTGRLRGGAIKFSACSSYRHHRDAKMVTRDYLGQIDAFAVYCRETSAVYLVPIEAVLVRNNGSLRVEASRNNQRSRVRFAADYLVGTVAVSRPAAVVPATLEAAGAA